MSKSKDLISHEYNGVVIYQQRDDGLINATAMCSVFFKDVIHWLRLNSTFELVTALATRLGIQAISIPTKKYVTVKTKSYKIYPTLVFVKRGAPESGGGTWIHSELTNNLNQWLQKTSSNKQDESEIKLSLLVDNPRYEVPTPAGKIDILTDYEIIEVKQVRGWKHAVGQIMVYSMYYPKHQKRIHLYGEHHIEYRLMICRHCQQLEIVVTFESIDHE